MGDVVNFCVFERGSRGLSGLHTFGVLIARMLVPCWTFPFHEISFFCQIFYIDFNINIIEMDLHTLIA